MGLKSILIKDVPDLEKAVDHTIDYVDVDYELLDPRKTATSSPWTARLSRSTIMRNERAIANAYRLWLQSTEWDYIRKPSFGGFFRANLNDRFPFSPESELPIKTSLIQESNLRWPDLVILDCVVKCGYPAKKWIVDVTIADKNTGMTIGSVNADLLL